MKRLLVALHDVTPALQGAVDRVLTLFDDLGLGTYSLLVVPDWHGGAPLESHSRFVDQIVRRHDHGAEIVLHGFRHDEHGHRRTVRDRVRVAGRTRASAEFAFLDREETERRLDRGQALFARLGLRANGFIPPAWIFGPHTRPALRDRGFRFTESFWRVEPLDGTKPRFTPALSWSTARRYRSRLTSRLAAIRRRAERGRGLVRVAIHPPDIEVPIVARSLRTTLSALLEERTPVSYGDALFGP